MKDDNIKVLADTSSHFLYKLIAFTVNHTPSANTAAAPKTESDKFDKAQK